MAMKVELTLPQLHALLQAVELTWDDQLTPRTLESLNHAEVKLRAAIKASEPKWPKEMS
jgi:hypothetical protein